MHDGAVAGQHGGLDQFVVPVDGELFLFLVDQRFDEGDEVAGKELAGAGGEAAGHVGVAHDGHHVVDDDLSGLRQFAVAAAFGRQIDDDRSGRHALDHRLADQLGRRASRDQRGGDDDILLGDVARGQRRLLGLVLGRHLLGVAARGLGLLELLVLDGDELAAQALDLLLGRRPHVVGRDHRAKPLGRGDGLQARDARAHDEGLGGPHSAGCGHHHREGSVETGGGVDDALVAGEIGLAGEYVHHLRAGDARHEFHGNGGDAGLGKSGDLALVAVGIHRPDNQRALGHALELAGGRPPHGEDDFGALERRLAACRDLGAGRRIVCIGEAGLLAGPLLDRNARAQPDQLGNRLGCRGDPGFSLGPLAHDSDSHEALLIVTGTGSP